MNSKLTRDKQKVLDKLYNHIETEVKDEQILDMVRLIVELELEKIRSK